MNQKSEYLAPHLRSYLEDQLRCRCDVSPNTIGSYRDGIKLLLAYASGRLKKPAVNLLVRDFSEAVVVGFLSDLEQSRGNSIQTRNHRLVGIRSLFAYIGEREPLLLECCREVVSIPKKRGAAPAEVGYLEKEEIAAVFAAIPRDQALGRRDYALLLYMYNTGARVQEVADTRRSWLTLVGSAKVTILGKGRKRRTCPLWDSTAEQLRLQLERRGEEAEDGHLFQNRSGRPLSRSGIAEILDRHVRKASEGLASLREKKVSPHTIRHTTAMHLLQSGVEANVIRSWLGHASISTTNRYIEIDLTMKRKALESCEVGPEETTLPCWKTDADILEWLESL